MFPSDVFHRNCGADDGTVKLTLFLCSSSVLQTAHLETEGRIRRSQSRYAQSPHNELVPWGLDRYREEAAETQIGKEGDDAGGEDASYDTTLGVQQEHQDDRTEKGLLGLQCL